MISATLLPCASPLKSAMAIGYWVAPTPEMSTRSCACAGDAANATAAASMAPAQWRHVAAWLRTAVAEVIFWFSCQSYIRYTPSTWRGYTPPGGRGKGEHAAMPLRTASSKPVMPDERLISTSRTVPSELRLARNCTVGLALPWRGGTLKITL